MVTDVLWTLNDAQIDAGAEALRERMQGGDKMKLRPWLQTPNSAKRKWREYAMIVLLAGRNTRVVK